MPISKYNDDGTVDIFNWKTGEVRTGVSPEELGTISPNLVAEYQVGQAPEKVLERKKTGIELEKLLAGETEKTTQIKTLTSDITLLEENRKKVSPLLRGPIAEGI